MSLKIFHTSDLHLGMKFSGYPEVQTALTEARFTTLKDLVDKANEQKCDLFVVAGDLFDRVYVDNKDIIRAAQILGDFHGNLVAVLPGNHDFVTMGSNDLWNVFEENTGDNVKVLKGNNAENLEHYDIDAILYPAPCYAKHSKENCVGWIKENTIDEDVKYHIGIAHGSLEGVSPDLDLNYYPMTHEELEDMELDIWLLGHTHIQYPNNPGTMDRVFYSGTPEPDGFDCTHEGKAWIFELDDSKRIHSTTLSTGEYYFLHEEISLEPSCDLEQLIKNSLKGNYENVLLKLKLNGSLSIEEYEKLPQIYDILPNIFYPVVDDYDVAEMIDQDFIDKNFTEGSFPHRLLSTLAEKEENWEALQTAYVMICEVRK